MTLITRPADVFKAGDRVYDKHRGEIFLVTSIEGRLVYGSTVRVFNSKVDTGRFLRVIEVGETIPKGAVTRYIEAGGLSETCKWFSEYVVDKHEMPLVLASLPKPEAETASNGQCEYCNHRGGITRSLKSWCNCHCHNMHERRESSEPVLGSLKPGDLSRGDEIICVNEQRYARVGNVEIVGEIRGDIGVYTKSGMYLRYDIGLTHFRLHKKADPIDDAPQIELTEQELEVAAIWAYRLNKDNRRKAQRLVQRFAEDRTTQNEVSHPARGEYTYANDGSIDDYEPHPDEIVRRVEDDDAELQSLESVAKELGLEGVLCNHSITDDAILQAAATLLHAEYLGALQLGTPFDVNDLATSRKWCVEQARELAAEIQKQNEVAE